MSTTAAEVLSAALKLSPEEREDLAEQLFDSLDGPGNAIDAMTDAEFEAELARRREEARRDPSVMIPWEEVRRELMGE